MKHLDPIIADFINKLPKNIFGQPLLRVVWSEDMREIRLGTFRDYVGNIFLREVTEARETAKYNYIHNRWVFEKWFPAEVAYSPEIPNSTQGDYAPFYTFEDKDKNPLELNLKVVEFLAFMALGNERPMSLSEHLRLEELANEKEIQDMMDSFEISEITHALHTGEAVGYGN